MEKEKTLALAKEIATILDAKKAKDVKIIYVHEKTVLADYFVIATGSSTTQVNSLADEVDFKLSTEKSISPTRVEGQGGGSWVLLDYDNIIVHVFSNEAREFYKLDKHWAEGEVVPFDAIED